MWRMSFWEPLRCSMSLHVAMCCSVLHCVTDKMKVTRDAFLRAPCVAVCGSVLQYVAACCSVLQMRWRWHAMRFEEPPCCSVLQMRWKSHATLIFSRVLVLQCVAERSSVLQSVTVCCSVLQCVATCYNVLQGVVVCCRSDEGDTPHVYFESLYVAFGCSWLKCVAV